MIQAFDTPGSTTKAAMARDVKGMLLKHVSVLCGLLVCSGNTYSVLKKLLL